MVRIEHIFKIVECSRLANYEIVVNLTIFMVLPLVDEHKSKCYICNNVFEDIEVLRKHQETDHGEYINFHKTQKREPAPGDVTIF